MVQQTEISGFTSDLNGAFRGLQDLSGASRKAEQEAKRLNATLGSLKSGLALPQKGGLVDDLQKGLAAATGEMTALSVSGKRLADGLGSALSRAFGKLVISGKDFKSVLKGLESDLLRLGTKALVGSTSGSTGSGFAGLLESLGSAFFGGAGSSSLIPGFAGGGEFTVGGRAGIDQNIVPLRLSKGERVTIETPAQQRQGAAAAPSPVINMAFNISTPDAASFRRSQSQIQGEALRQAQRSLRRNG
ncbi:MAG: hypothetical protein EP348_07305 [Alphaproteobacteria bacterium]|nr:MAG: hypothetical protein EP348_07305 [Alphaproteobacteria bacterium]